MAYAEEWTPAAKAVKDLEMRIVHRVAKPYKLELSSPTTYTDRRKNGVRVKIECSDSPWELYYKLKELGLKGWYVHYAKLPKKYPYRYNVVSVAKQFNFR